MIFCAIQDFLDTEIEIFGQHEPFLKGTRDRRTESTIFPNFKNQLPIHYFDRKMPFADVVSANTKVQIVA